MNNDFPTSAAPSHALCQQTYLLESDTGLLCRILGLYASRAIELTRVNVMSLDQSTMQLKVDVWLATQDDADSLRVLVAKASGFIGVLGAFDHTPAGMQAA